MKRIYIKEEVCIGCRLCEVYCIVQHSKSKDIIKAFKEEFPRALSRIRVEEAKPYSFALQCRHCREPSCVYACLTGAMYRDEDSEVVRHDAEKCIGCWSCIMFCPYGAIQRDDGKKIVSKCDLCLDIEELACVVNCPNRALIYQEVPP